MSAGKGRRAALAAGIGGALALAAAAIAFRGPILEEWHLYRFKNGGEEARKAAAAWMADHGTEKSFGVLLEPHLECSAEVLLQESYLADPSEEKYAEASNSRIIMSVLARASEPILERDRLDRAFRAIDERIGRNRKERIARSLLTAGFGSTRLRIYLARVVAANKGDAIGGHGPESLALGILRDALTDPDPYVRAGAAYGLADAGPRGRESLPAIEALKADPDEVVREAAENSSARLRDAGEAGR